MAKGEVATKFVFLEIYRVVAGAGAADAVRYLHHQQQ